MFAKPTGGVFLQFLKHQKRHFKLTHRWHRSGCTWTGHEGDLPSHQLQCEAPGWRHGMISCDFFSNVMMADDTVDGQNPAPPIMMIIPLFIGFKPSQVVVWDFFHQQYLVKFYKWIDLWLVISMTCWNTFDSRFFIYFHSSTSVAKVSQFPFPMRLSSIASSVNACGRRFAAFAAPSLRSAAMAEVPCTWQWRCRGTRREREVT